MVINQNFFAIFQINVKQFPVRKL